MRLWLDDVRPPPDGWTWVPSAAEAIEILGAGPVSEVSLDFDLEAEDGSAVSEWMAREHVWPTAGVAVHSSNVQGSQLMVRTIIASRLFHPVGGRPRSFRRPGDAFARYATASIEMDGRLLAVGDPAATLPSDSVCVITAADPLGEDAGAARNAAANARLRERLVQLGAEIATAGAGAADRSQWEAGFAVRGVAVDQVRRLGRAFGQHAIYTVGPAGVLIRDCRPLWAFEGRNTIHFRDLAADEAGARRAAAAYRSFARGSIGAGEMTSVLEQACPEVDAAWLMALGSGYAVMP